MNSGKNKVIVFERKLEIWDISTGLSVVHPVSVLATIKEEVTSTTCGVSVPVVGRCVSI